MKEDTTSTQVQISQTNDDNGKQSEVPTELVEDQIRHWWVYIARNFSDSVFSVHFVNVNNATENGEPLTVSELGLRWLVIALYRTNDLEAVFRKLLCHSDFLKLYDPKASLLL